MKYSREPGSGTFAGEVIHFNRSLRFDEPLPDGIRVMNPFLEVEAQRVSELFYRKYYEDLHPRKLIMAINPGRLGAGATGIPFTDTFRLDHACGISHTINPTHEPSSVFVYELIDAFGGPEIFYRDYFITSVSPLGFVKRNQAGREVNYNYYDSRELQQCMTLFILQCIRELLAFNVDTRSIVCWGRGKNFRFLSELNRENKFFGEIIPLDHPRFIMQYRAKQKDEYIRHFVEVLKRIPGA